MDIFNLIVGIADAFPPLLAETRRKDGPPTWVRRHRILIRVVLLIFMSPIFALCAVGILEWLNTPGHSVQRWHVLEIVGAIYLACLLLAFCLRDRIAKNVKLMAMGEVAKVSHPAALDIHALKESIAHSWIVCFRCDEYSHDRLMERAAIHKLKVHVNAPDIVALGPFESEQQAEEIVRRFRENYGMTGEKIYVSDTTEVS